MPEHPFLQFSVMHCCLPEIARPIRGNPALLTRVREALASVESHALLTRDQRAIRFVRLGKQPPIRGTVIQLVRRNYLIYTRGYIPFLRAYFYAVGASRGTASRGARR